MSKNTFNPGARYAWYVVVLLSLGQMIAFLDRLILGLLLEPIRIDLNLNDAQMGLIVGLSFALMFCAASVPLGRMLDVGNRRTIISICMFGWSVMTAVCGFAKSFTLLFLARAGVAIGEASLLPGAASILGDYLSPSRLGRAMAFMHVGAYLGSALAFLAGGALLASISGGWPNSPFGDLAGWQVAFLAASLPGAVLAVVIFTTVKEPPRKKAVTPPAKNAGVAIRYIFDNRRAFGLHLVFTTVASTFLNATTAWFPTFLVRKFDLEVGHAGMIFGTIILLFATSASVIGGAYADRLWESKRFSSFNNVFIIAACAAVVPGALYPLMGGLVPTLAMGTIFYFFAIMPISAAMAGFQLLTPPPIRGQVMAMCMATFTLLGLGVGPALVGFLSSLYGSEDGLPLALCSVSIVLAPIAAIAAWANRKSFAETALRAGSAGTDEEQTAEGAAAAHA